MTDDDVRTHLDDAYCLGRVAERDSVDWLDCVIEAGTTDVPDPHMGHSKWLRDYLRPLRKLRAEFIQQRETIRSLTAQLEVLRDRQGRST